MSVTKLGLIGNAGRMGLALSEHLVGIPDIEIHAGLEHGEPLGVFIGSQPDVVLDLSIGRAVDEHGEAVVRVGLPYIIGASGISDTTLRLLKKASAASGSPVLIVPNFSIGANLMIECAAKAARLMQSPVITEKHHMGKADAPSGTARYTAERVGAVQAEREQAPDGLAFQQQAPGALGAEIAGVPVHAVRGHGYLAEQAVELSLPGETLTIEHRSISRNCFMPGIEYAIRNIGKVRGLQVGLGSILDL